MGHEILVLHFGQTGVQIGSALWELFCIEHALTADGLIIKTNESKEFEKFENINCLFYEGQKSYAPRAVMIDLEPSVIDEIRCGAYRQLWKPNCLVTGNEDAASNYGRGNCTVGKLKMDDTMQAIRKLIEETNHLSAFEIIHSHSGGTGSGMTSLIIDQLCDEYGKVFKFSTSIFPSSMYSQSTVDPYNAVLHSHATIDTLDCDILLDNQTLFERCTKNLNINHPSYSEINRIIAQMLSSIFLSHRFIYHGSQHADTTELLTNLIPYPRIHFPSLFYAPLVGRDQCQHDTMSVLELTKSVFSEDAQTLDYPCRRNAYISCAMLYRGVNSPKQIYDALQMVKGTPSIGASFVDWCPTGFKIGINIYPPVPFTQSPLSPSPRSVCMLAGNLGMRDAWQRNNFKFDTLFSRRCFVHWFVGEGIEESEFIEARDDMAYLEQDYTELMSETLPESTNLTKLKNVNSGGEKSEIIHSRHSDSENFNSRFLGQPYPDTGSNTNNQKNNANTKYMPSVYDVQHIAQSRDHELHSAKDIHIDMEYGDGYNISTHMESDNVPVVYRSYTNKENNQQSYHPNETWTHSGKLKSTTSSPNCNVQQNNRESNNLWGTGDSYIQTNNNVDLSVHGSESAVHRYSREVNMNNARNSQASINTNSSPTDPVVQSDDRTSIDREHSIVSTQSKDICKWDHTCNLKHIKKVSYKHSRCHSRRGHRDDRSHASEWITQPYNSSQYLNGLTSGTINHTTKVGFISDEFNEDLTNSSCPAVIFSKVADTYRFQTVGNRGDVPVSNSSGFGTMVASNYATPARTASRTTFHESMQAHSSNGKRHHHRHHHHHHQHDHDKALQLSDGSNESFVSQSTKEFKNRQKKLYKTTHERLGKTMSNQYLSASMLTKRSIYEVSVSSSPDDRQFATPVLSTVSFLSNPRECTASLNQ